jgi:hypothetical protein
MALAIWRPGRRVFTSAAILMLVMAAAHTAGFLAAAPSNPVEERLFADMEAVRNPLGLGMSPSFKDIFFGLAFTLSTAFAGLGVMNLTLAAIPETPDRVLRAAAWVNALWVAAFLILSWAYRVPPPLIFGAIVGIAVAASLIDLRRYDERRQTP